MGTSGTMSRKRKQPPRAQNAAAQAPANTQDAVELEEEEAHGTAGEASEPSRPAALREAGAQLSGAPWHPNRHPPVERMHRPRSHQQSSHARSDAPRCKKAVPPVKAVCFHDCPTAFLPRATAFLPRNCVHCNAQALRYRSRSRYLPNEYR